MRREASAAPDVAARLGVYLVTDRAQTRDRPLLDVVESALRGGVRAVQLRERDLTARETVRLARDLRALTGRYGALLLVNDRIDIALACDADGVHLPSSSFRAADARTLLGPKRLVGVSAHSAGEIESAATQGADFAVFGPVFDTPSKRAFGPPQGLTTLAAVCAGAALPVLAIGGINAGNLADVRACGAAGVAVIRAVLAAPDAERAARELVEGFVGRGEPRKQTPHRDTETQS